MKKIYKTIDLFAGIGGIRAGFEKAGFETVYAIDSDRNCKETYDANFETVPLKLGDVKDIEANDLPDFDILLAGFPCQPFSVAGHKQGFKDKERGNAFFHMMEIVDEKKPDAIFLENVKHLMTHDKGVTYKTIKEKLSERGFYVKEQVLNSANYGNVPQNRERIYIVAFRSPLAKEAFHFPGPIPLTKRVTDLLDEEVDRKYYYRKGWLYDRIKGNMRGRDHVYQWRRVYLRKGGTSGVCFTLTANMGMGGHNVPLIRDHKGMRRITPRECCRLQGFKDNFILPDHIADGQLYKQIGNSVSVPVIARIAGRVKKALVKQN